MKENTNIIRANKLTVKVDANGNLVADLFRTHKHLTTIAAEDTEFRPDENATKTAIREDFRKWIAEHATEFGYNFDPTDRRTAENTRRATYQTEQDVANDAVAMVTPDIVHFISKMPHAELVNDHTILVESLTPKTHTAKGTDLATMGIEQGKYASNGNLAWFDIEGTVTMNCGGTEIYQPIQMELVSGQLKKFRMTQTQWNTETTKSLVEAGLVEMEAPKTKAKAEKSAKAEDATAANMDVSKDCWDEMEEFAEHEGNLYRVEYQVKAGHPRGEFHVETMDIAAQNAKEACKMVKEIVQAKNGYNAFNPKATKVG